MLIFAPMPRYFIQLAYNGANYNGWQEQDNTPHTVQQVIREKLSMILGEAIEITGCGRTDTGVHAKDYYAHFDSEKNDLHLLSSNCVYKLNKVLPYEIAVKQIYAVKPEASARFDAEWRSYDYYIHRQKDPFLFNTSMYVFGELDFDLMNAAAAHLLTVIDFTSFSKVNTQTFTNNCTVTEARWEKLNDHEYVFRITANRFLRNMVRAIVGTLLEAGRGKLSIDQFKAICESKNRSEAGMSAPGHALYLTHIHYPETIFNV
jgi:tRNA pseudouridine38-40 synthase